MILCQHYPKLCHRSPILLPKCAKIAECAEINVKNMLIKRKQGRIER